AESPRRRLERPQLGEQPTAVQIARGLAGDHQQVVDPHLELRESAPAVPTGTDTSSSREGSRRPSVRGTPAGTSPSRRAAPAATAGRRTRSPETRTAS